MVGQRGDNNRNDLHSNIWQQLFGSWDRRYSFISIVVTIAAAGFSLLAVKYPEQLSVFLVIRDLTFAFTLIGFVAFLTYKYVRMDNSRERLENSLHAMEQKQSQEIQRYREYIHNQLDRTYNVVHDSVSQLFMHYQSVLSRKAELQVTLEQFELFEDMCREITTQVRESFKAHFNSQGINIEEDISVAVKLVLPSSDILRRYEKRLAPEEVNRLKNSTNSWAITVYRDNYTFRNKPREIGLKLYNVEQNTAFHCIMVMNEPYFICNDLSNLAGYRNQNPNWEQYYNAAIVMPIALNEPPAQNARQAPLYFGMLSVDNMKHGNLFDEQECVSILGHAADMLCTFFMAAVLHYFVEN